MRSGEMGRDAGRNGHRSGLLANLTTSAAHAPWGSPSRCETSVRGDRSGPAVSGVPDWLDFETAKKRSPAIERQSGMTERKLDFQRLGLGGIFRGGAEAKTKAAPWTPKAKVGINKARQGGWKSFSLRSKRIPFARRCLQFCFLFVKILEVVLSELVVRRRKADGSFCDPPSVIFVNEWQRSEPRSAVKIAVAGCVRRWFNFACGLRAASRAAIGTTWTRRSAENDCDKGLIR